MPHMLLYGTILIYRGSLEVPPPLPAGWLGLPSLSQVYSFSHWNCVRAQFP